MAGLTTGVLGPLSLITGLNFFYAGLLRWDDTELALLQGSPWMLVAGQGSS